MEPVNKYYPRKPFRIRVTQISGIAKLAQDKGPVDSKIAMNFLAGRDNAASRPLFERLLLESGVPG